MIEFIVSIILVVAVILTCRFYLGMRIFTSLTAGVVVGWISTGIMLSVHGGFEDFDSSQLAERRRCHAVYSTLAVVILLIHLIIGAHRESMRRRQTK